MHNEKIDFSALPKIAPRADSWDKVCARLDVANFLEKPKSIGTRNILQFRMSAAIPLAASFIFICLYLLLTAANLNNSGISMDSVTSSEFVSWYEALGEEGSDEFEILDNETTISYLMKE